MISASQRDYYCRRAAEERDAAAVATDPTLADLHQRMARVFESLVSELDRPRNAIAPGW